MLKITRTVDPPAVAIIRQLVMPLYDCPAGVVEEIEGRIPPHTLHQGVGASGPYVVALTETAVYGIEVRE